MAGYCIPVSEADMDGGEKAAVLEGPKCGAISVELGMMIMGGVTDSYYIIHTTDLHLCRITLVRGGLHKDRRSTLQSSGMVRQICIL